MAEGRESTLPSPLAIALSERHHSHLRWRVASLGRWPLICAPLFVCCCCIPHPHTFRIAHTPTRSAGCSTLALSRGRRTAMDACAHVQGRAELTVTALCSSAKHLVHSSHTDASHHKHQELCQLANLRDISHTNSACPLQSFLKYLTSIHMHAYF